MTKIPNIHKTKYIMNSESYNAGHHIELILRLKRALNEVLTLTNKIKQLNSMDSNCLPDFSRDALRTNITKFEINYN